MRKVFYFSSALSFEKIDGLLKSSPVIYWLCNIKLREGMFFQKPYWQYTDMGREIIFRQHHAATENEIPAQVRTRDITIRSERFIEADLVTYIRRLRLCSILESYPAGCKRHYPPVWTFKPAVGKQTPEFWIVLPGAGKKAGIITHIRNMYKVKHFVQDSARPPCIFCCWKNEKRRRHHSSESNFIQQWRNKEDKRKCI